MGTYALVRLLNFSSNHDRLARIYWVESNSYILKLYCFNVDFKYGYEYPHNCKISTIKGTTLPNKEAVIEASKKMMLPILYTVLTTICAFLSLIFSDIKPIIDFGWMMTLGLIVSLTVTFLLPSLLSIFSSNDEISIKDTEKSFVTQILGSIAKKNHILFGPTIIVIVASIIGILKLEVENSFINYFDKETEIYKGMKKIDDELGEQRH